MCLSTSVPAAARQAGGMAPPPPLGLFAGIAEFSALSFTGAAIVGTNFLGLVDHLDARLLEDKRFCGEALRGVVAITCKKPSGREEPLALACAGGARRYFRAIRITLRDKKTIQSRPIRPARQRPADPRQDAPGLPRTTRATACATGFFRHCAPPMQSRYSAPRSLRSMPGRTRNPR